MSSAPSHRPVLALFLVSGALGLGYQVLWSKIVLLFVGVSSWSYAVVLAAFMAGLALGARLLGHLADRVASPLKLFAFLELGVGLYAVAYSPLAEAAGRAYLAGAGASDAAGGMVGLGTKAALAGLLLLPPTILMGGTWPALVRHASTLPSLASRRAAQLYSVNALGAVLGAIVMAFVLMPNLGIRASLMLLALGNAGVGLVALALARREAPARAQDAAPARPADAARGAGRDLPVLFLLFGVGLLSFIYEIAWTRFFTLVVGSSTYSFAIIVASFILGIGIAGAIVARLDARLERPLAFFGWTQLGAAALVLVPLPAYPYLTWAFGRLGDAIPATGGGYVAYEGLKLLACCLVMLPATILLGMSVPLGVKALAEDFRGLGRATGRLAAWNTAGNVLGALIGGLVLLPLLGMERLLRVSAVATVAFGLLALALAARSLHPRALGRAVPFGGALLVLAVLLPAWNPAWFALVPFRRESMGSRAFAEKTIATRKVLLFKEDPAANITIVEMNGKFGVGRTLLVNGKPDASNLGDMPTQMLLGHLPLLLSRDPRDVLVIGLASGMTCGAVLRHPVERMDVVDIVQAMPAASRYFDEWSGRPLDDPRTRFVADDARSFLTTTKRRYDVVISEPSNPWMAGIGSLFSREFYEHAALRLKPGGVYCQWVQAYELSDATFATILATFRRTFPHVAVFEGLPSDLLLIGSLEPIRLDPQALEVRMTPAVREQLAPLGADDPVRLLYLQCFSQVTCDWIAALAGEHNTDDNLLLEYQAPRDLFLRASPTLVRRFDERARVAPSLAWSEAMLAGADRLSAVRVMQRRSCGNAGLYTSWLAALARTSDEGLAVLTRDMLAVLPPGAAFRPPSDGAVATELREAVARADAPAVSRIVAREGGTLACEALVSPAAANEWAAELGALATGGPPGISYVLGGLRADVLAAAGQRHEALEQLRALVPLGVGDGGEIIVRVCRLDPGARCDRIVAAIAARQDSDVLERFHELRAGPRTAGVAAAQ